VPRRKCPAGPQGRIRRRSEPRMRVAAGSAVLAARPIAQISRRVVMAFKYTLVVFGQHRGTR
jgi:hypothetical protein